MELISSESPAHKAEDLSYLT
jgi:hypothetical protein